MEVAVIGGTGRIGAKVVNRLRDHGHKVVAASPSTGVDTLTGDGLSQALTGVDVVVDVIDSPSAGDGAHWFFSTSTMHLISQEKTAGVGYHIRDQSLFKELVGAAAFQKQ